MTFGLGLCFFISLIIYCWCAHSPAGRMMTASTVYHLQWRFSYFVLELASLLPFQLLAFLLPWVRFCWWRPLVTWSPPVFWPHSLLRSQLWSLLSSFGTNCHIMFANYFVEISLDTIGIDCECIGTIFGFTRKISLIHMLMNAVSSEASTAEISLSWAMLGFDISHMKN